jgi:hypothetical protein
MSTDALPQPYPALLPDDLTMLLAVGRAIAGGIAERQCTFGAARAQHAIAVQLGQYHLCPILIGFITITKPLSQVI